MEASEPSPFPSDRVCEQARQSRDPRFDGLFFTAVTSTRIYCRPVCPAPTPKCTNIVYYRTAAAAEAAGFRPCLRCRPELSPLEGSWRRGDAAVARALKLIHQGFLADHSLSVLASRVNVGDRQLRRLFLERIGASAIDVHCTHRLLFAKQLLTETRLPITEVALSAGFGSLRRFNATFKDAYRMAPRELRRKPVVGAGAERGDVLTLRLEYRPPFDLTSVMQNLRRQALPGIESVDDVSYTRAIADVRGEAASGWFRISAWRRGENALKLELHATLAPRLLDIVARLRRMFDLDADPRAINAALASDRVLRPLLQKHPGVRLVGGWNDFEVAVRATINHHTTAAEERRFATLVMQRFGAPLCAEYQDQGLTHLFPSPQILADAHFEGIGLPKKTAATIRNVAQALLDGRLDFGVDRTLDDFVVRWAAIPGISLRTANYIALRTLGHPDAFPVDAQSLLSLFSTVRVCEGAEAAYARSECWRPWRAYALQHMLDNNRQHMDS